MPDRTPLFAANWKMHKTVEEAERSLAELLPRVPGRVRGRRWCIPRRSPRSNFR